ncbi:hypothetical protein KUD11_02700 [Roseovarius sp. LXJ103]|uniref:MotE family protein n=1 Tax=Roseovarius carneus TaxID=2853164 RepID=UPI000D620901|nr:hypothetical protein [Roseovarius carneus]MBZ8117549.1 hypothetical protein [Roseovarius carneus]PWE36657.1 hypothetical protein DD563_12240 [Pelagicola sp. LXJ1103]
MSAGKRKSPHMRAGRGALILIAGLLVGSAVLRVGLGAGEAWARSEDPINVTALEPAPMQCESQDDLQRMLESFQAREARIGVQEEAMIQRMQALKLADEEINRKLASLLMAEEELRATISMADTAAEGDISRLVKVYENMKPKQAAALFEEMNPEFAAGFLGRMRPEAAAGIMAGLSPGAAHSFSVVLAGRNAEAPTE